MPRYRLFIRFELADKEGNTQHPSYENFAEFVDEKAAEEALEDNISAIVADFSDEILEWKILDKLVLIQENQKETDLPTLLLL